MERPTMFGAEVVGDDDEAQLALQAVAAAAVGTVRATSSQALATAAVRAVCSIAAALQSRASNGARGVTAGTMVQATADRAVEPPWVQGGPSKYYFIGEDGSDSVPELEDKECWNKAQALLAAIEPANAMAKARKAYREQA